MGNVFPPNRDIHETYDLKGSTVGRYSEPKPDGTMRVMKDLNFLERHKKLRLGPEKRKLFLEQIEKDAHFLANHNIMDYSLLLGIHDLTRGNTEDIRNRQLSIFEVRRRSTILFAATDRHFAAEPRRVGGQGHGDKDAAQGAEKGHQGRRGGRPRVHFDAPLRKLA